MKVSFTLDDFEQKLIKFSPIVPAPSQTSRTVTIAQFSLSNSQAQGLILSSSQSYLASLEDLRSVAVPEWQSSSGVGS